jgi:hypothetical protein
LIKQRQNQCITKSIVALVVPFNVCIDARYNRVKLVGDDVVLWASKVDLHKFVKKLDMFII